ncbi:MAG: 30S ribosomal protein S8 [Thermodesulfobacteriota bacterium]
MSMTDPLADMLTRIRNGLQVRFESIDVPASNLKKGVAEILKQEGYISGYQTAEEDGRPTLRINLKYDEHHQGVIVGLKRVSKPGRRVYVAHDQIPKVMSGLGISILSTSRGIMADKSARAEKVGGELLCQVW